MLSFHIKEESEAAAISIISYQGPKRTEWLTKCDSSWDACCQETVSAILDGEWGTTDTEKEPLTHNRGVNKLRAAGVRKQSQDPGQKTAQRPL